MIQQLKIKHQLLNVSSLFQGKIGRVDTGILSVQLQQEVRGATEKLRDFYENFHGRKDIVVFQLLTDCLETSNFCAN